MQTPDRRSALPIYALAVLPALVLLRAVDLNAVSVPFMDDWQFIPLVEQVRNGEVPWRDLAAPHDEHRLLIPRLLIIATTILSGGNYRVQCFLTVAVVAALSLALLSLLRRALGPGRRTAFAWLLANLVLFSPIQWHNWLWPMQFAYFLPFAFLVFALAAYASELRPGLRHGLAQLFAWGATWSFIQGLLVWPVLLAVVARDERLAASRRAWTLGAWTASGALACFLYLHGLWDNAADPAYAYLHQGVPPTDSTLAMLREEPVRTLGRMRTFALAMFGNALARGFPVDSNLELAIAVGFVLFVAGGALWWHLARRERLGGVGFSFVALLVHGFLTAALVGLGRVWAGPGQPLTPRYTTFGTFCVLPVVILACVALADGAATPLEGEREDAWQRRALLACGALLAVLAVNWSYGLVMMREWREAQLVSRAGVHFAPVLRTPLLSYSGGRPKFLRGRIAILDRLGYWEPPLAKDRRLDQFRVGRAIEGQLARIERVRAERGLVHLEGYARFNVGGEVPHALLVTSEDPDGTAMIRSVCALYTPPRWHRHGFMRDYEFVLREERPLSGDYGRFHCTVHRRALPAPKEGRLRLYALDFARGIIRRLHDEVDLATLRVAP